MRAYEIPLPFANYLGLRSTATPRVNTPSFSAASNFMITEDGIVEPNTITALETILKYRLEAGGELYDGLPEAYSFPYPKLFLGAETALLVYETTLWEIDRSDPTEWVAEQLSPIDHRTGLDFVIPPGDGWDWADFGATWFLFKPEDASDPEKVGCTLFKVNRAGLYGNENHVYGQSAVRINSGAAYRGRLLLGGFAPDRTGTRVQPYDPTTFADLMEHYADCPESFANTESLTYWLKQNTVWWSTIGGGDTLFFFYPELAMQGILEGWEAVPEGGDVRRAPLFEYLRMGQCGWINMESPGRILKVLPFGKNVAVYSTDSVTLLTDVADGIVPTFGRTLALRSGPASKDLIVGDSQEHLWVGGNGDLWKWTAGSAPTNVGYKEFFSGFSLTPAACSVSNHAGDRAYYLSGTSAPTTYALTNGKLAELPCYRGLTSVTDETSDQVGVYAAAPSATLYASFTTCPIDLANRGKKVAVQAELTGSFPASTTTYIKVGTRIAPTADFTWSSYYNFNSQGVVKFRHIGVEFAFQILVVGAGAITPVEQLQISDLKISYQQLDKRFKISIPIGAVEKDAG